MTKYIRNANSLNILFVDDDGTSRMIGSHLLENHPGNVVVAINGDDALEKIKKHRFDIVFTDINMPIMNGIELIKVLAKKRPELPVISMSGSYTEQHTKEYLDLGFKGLLNKPLQKKQLFAVIDQYCGSKVLTK